MAMVSTTRSVERERGLQHSELKAALCFVPDGDADKLVESMMTHLNTISDATFATLVPLYADVLDDLVKCSCKWCRASSRSGDDDMNERVRERRCANDDDDMIERAREWRETADGDDTRPSWENCLRGCNNFW